MKDKIEQWLDAKTAGYRMLTPIKDVINDCFNDLQPQWVSVDDRLPEVNQLSRWVRESDSVLVTDDKGSQCVAFYSNEFDGTNGGWVLPAQRFAKIGQHPDFNISQYITHWQPLPLPPSEELNQ
jgi:hypothetical protein